MQEQRAAQPGALFWWSLVASSSVGLIYWAAIWMLRPDEPFSVSLLYRFTDADYLPLIFGLAQGNFGEPFVWENLGQGLQPFPFGSIAPHALCVALLGPAGFIVADVLIAALRFLVLYLLACQILTSRSLAAVAACAAVFALGPSGLSFLSTLWEFRYPRPYVTNVYYMGCIACLLAHVKDRLSEGELRRWPLALLAIFWGLLLQGDAYGAIGLALLISAVFLWDCLRVRVFPKAWLGALGIVAAVIAPFIWQNLSMPADMKARWGWIEAPRWPPLFDLQDRAAKALILYGSVAVLLLSLRYWGRPAWRRVPAAPAVLAFALVVGAVAALPFSWILLGGGVQLFHFPDRQLTASILGLLLVALLALEQLTWFHLWSPRRWQAAALTVILAVSGTVLLYRNSAADWVTLETQPRVTNDSAAFGAGGFPPADGYRSALAALLLELDGPSYENAKVLGSFDNEVQMLWQLRPQAGAYGLHSFLTLASTDELERRTFSLLSALGATPSLLDELLSQHHFVTRFVGHARYLVHRAEWNRDDYSDSEQMRIAETPLTESWQIIVPASERRRLQSLLATSSAPGHRLDIVILTRIGTYSDLALTDPAFDKTFDNGIFAVWLRRDLR